MADLRGNVTITNIVTDGDIDNNGGTYVRDNNTSPLTIDEGTLKRGYIEFDISSIPDTAL
ncbi:unnamed protein product, partial [marine sediment metagenome]